MVGLLVVACTTWTGRWFDGTCSSVTGSMCTKSGSSSSAQFQELLAKCGNLQLMFQSFVDDCNSKSEMCQYWTAFLQMALVIKHVVSSDREGNFALHMASSSSSSTV